MAEYMDWPGVLQTAMRVGLAVATAAYLRRVLEPRTTRGRMLAILSLILSAIAVFYRMVPRLYYLSSEAAPTASMAVALLEAALVIGLLKLLTRDGWAKILLFYSLSLLISVLSSLAPFALLGLFGGESVPTLVASRWNDLLLSFISAVLNATLLIVAGEAVSHYVRRQTVELKWGQFAPVVGAQAVSLILCAGVAQGGAGAKGRLTIVLAILVVIYALVDAVQIWAFRAVVKNSELTREIDALRKYQQLQRDYYLSVAEQMRAARRLRHDYRNTLLTMDALIDGGEVERARLLAVESGELLSAVGPGYYTGNDILDAVLNGKAREAQRDGIAFSVDLTLPAPLNISDVDLMSIFANLLDNAIEYERGLPEGAEKCVAVSGGVRAGLWALTFSNAYSGRTKPSFETTKRERTEHGHGREIVRTILQRYDGTFSDRVENGMYTVDLTLNVA